MILFTGFLLLVLYLSYRLYQNWIVYKHLLDNFNSPPRNILFGSLSLFPKDAPGIFRTFQGFVKKYGKNFVLARPFFQATLIITDPKDMETILLNPNTKKAKKSVFYDSMHPWLGTGLLTAYGDKWFTRRKIITPSFHFSILDSFVEVMGRQSDILVQNLKSEVGGDFVDIYPIINAFALDVICETSMGVTVQAQSNPNSEYVTSVKKISREVQKRAQHPLFIFPMVYDQTSAGREFKNLVTILHNFTNKVIRQRRDQLLQTDSADKGSRMNFLDILLHATVNGQPLTDEDIREEVDTFMFEGHDTTASGIAFTLYLLAKHADIQDKVYQELSDIFGKKDEMKITSKKLGELPYMEMVIKESLRLLPPVPGIGRQLLEDTMISGVRVPAGVNLGLSIYGMQHNPENFPDPEKFDPERFSPYNEATKHKLLYVPFSAGGRNCIGQKFAMMDLKACISKIIMNYRLLPGSDIIPQGDLILKPSNGILIKFENR